MGSLYRDQRACSLSPPCEDTVKRQLSAIQGGALRHRPYWPLDLGFQFLELGENEFWLLKPKLSLMVFVWQSGFPGGSEVKVSASNAGDLGSIPGSGISPGEGNGNPLQYSCLENPMDGGAWWATVHGVAKSRTQTSDFHFHFHFL